MDKEKTTKIRIEALPRTWRDILKSMEKGEVIQFNTGDAGKFNNARTAISMYKRKYPDKNFTTKTYDGYFTIERIS